MQDVPRGCIIPARNCCGCSRWRAAWMAGTSPGHDDTGSCLACETFSICGNGGPGDGLARLFAERACITRTCVKYVSGGMFHMKQNRNKILRPAISAIKLGLARFHCLRNRAPFEVGQDGAARSHARRRWQNRRGRLNRRGKPEGNMDQTSKTTPARRATRPPRRRNRSRCASARAG